MPYSCHKKWHCADQTNYISRKETKITKNAMLSERGLTGWRDLEDFIEEAAMADYVCTLHRSKPCSELVALLQSNGAFYGYSPTKVSPRWGVRGTQIILLVWTGIDWMVKMKRICVYTNDLLMMMAVSFRQSVSRKGAKMTKGAK